MTVGHQDHGGIALAVAIAFRRLDQRRHLGRREVLPAPEFGVWPADEGNCSVFARWWHQLQVRFRAHFRASVSTTARTMSYLRAVCKPKALRLSRDTVEQALEGAFACEPGCHRRFKIMALIAGGSPKTMSAGEDHA